jgi:flagellar assembly factor FliW
MTIAIPSISLDIPPPSALNVSVVEVIPPDRVMLVNTRIGPMRFDLGKLIELPRGLPGFPHARRVGLLHIPERFGPFVLVQVMEDAAISFLALPQDCNTALFAPGDLRQAAIEYGIDPDRQAVLLVTTFRGSKPYLEISANLRAPILLDVPLQRAVQPILMNDRYSVRHRIAP